MGLTGAIKNYQKRVSTKGLKWTSLFLMRSAGIRVVDALENSILNVERKLFSTDQDSLACNLNTRSDNFAKWDVADWSEVGTEWTNDAGRFKGLDSEEWKKKLLANFMDKFLPENAVTLEIGPGGGRWTEELLNRGVKELYAADVSVTSIDTCKEKFAGKENLHLHLIDVEDQTALPANKFAANSFDFVWSYDVFIHINPHDISGYIRDFARIMKDGALGVIHHAGSYHSESFRREFFRSNMDAPFFKHLLEENGLTLIEQDMDSAHFPGDVISVFKK